MTACVRVRSPAADGSTFGILPPVHSHGGPATPLPWQLRQDAAIDRRISRHDVPINVSRRDEPIPRSQTRLFGDPVAEPEPAAAPAPSKRRPTEPDKASEPDVVSVADVTRLVADTMSREPGLRNVWIRGEVSNFKAHVSGHWYFSLKDDESQIGAACFRGANSRIPFEPENGLSVIALGTVEVYKPQGKYQVIVRDMKPDGAGALALAYEQLRRRLDAEGIFDEARKRPLPPMPRRVGVITSMSGAAVRDVVSVAQRRWPGVQLILRGARVQGEGAAEEVARAIRLFNENDAADVLIVGRGGGSMEDLWAFNEEVVVRAIAASRIPVVSAVGHETDFTLADFAADLRAPTPSAAAEIVVPSAADLIAALRQAEADLARRLTSRVSLARERYASLTRTMAARRPDRLLAERAQRLDDARERLAFAARTHADRGRRRLAHASSLLHSLSPLNVLARGYAVAFNEAETVLRSVNDVPDGAAVRVMLHDGDLDVEVRGRRTRNDSPPLPDPEESP